VAIAGAAPPLRSPFTPFQSIAYATVSPTTSDANAALANNPHLTARMASGQVIAVGTVAASSTSANTTTRTYAASIAITADFTDVSGPHDLMIGFHDPVIAGLGFDSLEMTILRHGTTVLDQVFTGVPLASTYLTDHLIDLGLFKHGGLRPGGPGRGDDPDNCPTHRGIAGEPRPRVGDDHAGRREPRRQRSRRATTRPAGGRSNRATLTATGTSISST
jgi:hypothetical protein